MKKSLIIFILLLFISTTLFTYGVENQITITDEDTDLGVVGVYINGDVNNRVKLLVEKDGTRYSYNLYEKDEIQLFPLQMGNGSYRIRVMENTEGNKYKTVLNKEININLQDSSITYLNSIQEINWKRDNKAIIKASEITEGIDCEQQKLEAIYSYIVKNIKYDYEKISTITSSYLPDIDEILESGQGICYDYSSLFAAMMRSVGVPTKMVKGYTDLIPNEYHAWNEVLINGEWKIIDTTFDAAYIQDSKNVDMLKTASDYNGEKEF
ncbi:transglutaminase domain-containing protein [Alkaliphilus pronyensis]|uniref:Transglutaminase domain-containing protein n=1 Tax=Alkaliphilus pronyensis TaxID=1482732 RepID=A0A6I0FD70_9FIRM|nr:transglutaminase-like domain-containing protein [Alkaliphilus pronyensis]KAB3531911.1 transglutaminase domain-containing protein [Alkaliphilus pronyensis]